MKGRSGHHQWASADGISEKGGCTRKGVDENEEYYYK
jgi:hypothetical protein